MASIKGHTEIVDLLLEADADPNNVADNVSVHKTFSFKRNTIVRKSFVYAYSCTCRLVL